MHPCVRHMYTVHVHRAFAGYATSSDDAYVLHVSYSEFFFFRISFCSARSTALLSRSFSELSAFRTTSSLFRNHFCAKSRTAVGGDKCGLCAPSVWTVSSKAPLTLRAISVCSTWPARLRSDPQDPSLFAPPQACVTVTRRLYNTAIPWRLLHGLHCGRNFCVAIRFNKFGRKLFLDLSTTDNGGMWSPIH